MNRQTMLAEILRAHPGNDSAAQRRRLLAAMQQTGHVTTFEAMRLLDCYDPRPRILELRREYSISTNMRQQETESGKTHRVGVYALNVPGRSK